MPSPQTPGSSPARNAGAPSWALMLASPKAKGLRAQQAAPRACCTHVGPSAGQRNPGHEPAPRPGLGGLGWMPWPSRWARGLAVPLTASCPPSPRHQGQPEALRGSSAPKGTRPTPSAHGDTHSDRDGLPVGRFLCSPGCPSRQHKVGITVPAQVRTQESPQQAPSPRVPREVSHGPGGRGWGAHAAGGLQ